LLGLDRGHGRVSRVILAAGFLERLEAVEELLPGFVRVRACGVMQVEEQKVWPASGGPNGTRAIADAPGERRSLAHPAKCPHPTTQPYTESGTPHQLGRGPELDNLAATRADDTALSRTESAIGVPWIRMTMLNCRSIGAASPVCLKVASEHANRRISMRARNACIRHEHLVCQGHAPVVSRQITCAARLRRGTPERPAASRTADRARSLLFAEGSQLGAGLLCPIPYHMLVL
jgi:hypothetical protein